MSRLRATVIGGGVVGCAVAYRLAAAGADVALVDSRGIAGGASGQSGGHVIVWPDDENHVRFELAVEGYVLFKQLLEDTKARAEADPMDHSLELLFVAFDEAGRADLQRQAARVEDAGFDAFWVDRSGALRLEPRLSAEVIGGVVLPDCVQVGGREFCALLAEAATSEGARVIVDEVVRLHHDTDGASRIELRRQPDLGTDIVVLATGSWTAALVEDWLGVSLPVVAHSLQRLRLSPAGEQLHCGIHWDDVNITPRRDGQIHAGSFPAPSGFDAVPTPEATAEIVSRVNRALPRFEFTIAGQDLGVAAATPDSMPLLGAVPGHDGVYVAVPADDGFCVSAVMAQALTRLALNGERHSVLSGDVPVRPQSA